LVKTESGVRARSDNPRSRGPAPDFRRAQLPPSRKRRPRPARHHQHFMAPRWAAVHADFRHIALTWARPSLLIALAGQRSTLRRLQRPLYDAAQESSTTSVPRPVPPPIPRSSPSYVRARRRRPTHPLLRRGGHGLNRGSGSGSHLALPWRSAGSVSTHWPAPLPARADRPRLGQEALGATPARDFRGPRRSRGTAAERMRVSPVARDPCLAESAGSQ
jgi:hypothetical protein